MGYGRYAIVEKKNHHALHGIFGSREGAEKHLRDVVPGYVAKSYYDDKTLRADSFEVIEYEPGKKSKSRPEKKKAPPKAKKHWTFHVMSGDPVASQKPLGCVTANTNERARAEAAREMGVSKDKILLTPGCKLHEPAKAKRWWT